MSVILTLGILKSNLLGLFGLLNKAVSLDLLFSGSLYMPKVIRSIVGLLCQITTVGAPLALAF
jgi:hypothetical protein